MPTYSSDDDALFRGTKRDHTRQLASYLSRTPRIDYLDLNDPAVITNTRATEASYYTGPETDGTAAFLAWQPAQAGGVPRMQFRGHRRAIFLEGPRTNLLIRSQDLTHTGGWTVEPAPTRAVQTGAAAKAPDGAMLATRVVSSITQLSSNQDVNPGSPSIATAWYRARLGTSPAFMNYYAAFGGSPVAASSLTTTYQRVMSRIPSATAPGSFYPQDGTLVGAAPSDIYIALMQVEAAYFASSTIRTTTAAVTRNADACHIVAARVPTWMQSGKWDFTFSLECTSAEVLLNATEMTLMAFGVGVGNRIALIIDAGALKLRVVQGGVTRVTTGALTMTSRYLDVSVVLDSVAGSVAIAGATTGNGTTVGTTWTMPAGDVYLGNVSTAGTPFYGEILPTIGEVA